MSLLTRVAAAWLRRIATAACVLGLLAVAGCAAWRWVPDALNPLEPLDLDAPELGFFTEAKLGSLVGDPEECLGVLAAAPLEFEPIEDRAEGEFCGYFDAVAITRSTFPYSGPVRVTCPLAAALYLWEKAVVEPAALEHLDTTVSQVQHAGTYSCRRVYGRRTGRPSQHATANAIDVVGFRLEDGSTIRVDRHWGARGPRGEFLRAVRDGSCRVFRAVLGPDYNRAHADHFHLDLGRWSTCS